MPSQETVLLVSDQYADFIGCVVHLADGRRLPVLDETGEPANLRPEIIDLRGVLADESFVDRLKAGLASDARA